MTSSNILLTKYVLLLLLWKSPHSNFAVWKVLYLYCKVMWQYENLLYKQKKEEDVTERKK